MIAWHIFNNFFKSILLISKENLLANSESQIAKSITLKFIFNLLFFQNLIWAFWKRYSIPLKMLSYLQQSQNSNALWMRLLMNNQSN